MKPCVHKKCYELATKIATRGSEEIHYCQRHYNEWMSIMEAIGA